MTVTPLYTDDLYYVASLPQHWIAREGRRLVIFGACATGWSNRTPYRGHPEALRRASTPKLALGTGWPGAANTP